MSRFELQAQDGSVLRVVEALNADQARSIGLREMVPFFRAREVQESASMDLREAEAQLETALSRLGLDERATRRGGSAARPLPIRGPLTNLQEAFVRLGLHPDASARAR